jgi:exopolysaccharide biosynthesis polyprenyl glycosylphosphotransferase
MSATTEQPALHQPTLLYDEIAATLDPRTREILDRRRGTSGVRRRGWLVRRTLLLADLLGLSIAFLLAQTLFGLDFEANDHINPATEYLIFMATLPFWIVVAKLYGLYERDEERTDHSTADDVVGVFHLVTVGAWMFFVGAWLTGLVGVDIAKLLSFWVFAILFVGIGRALARSFCRRRLTYLQNAVIVGAGDVGQVVARKLLQHPEYGINLVGFVDSDPKERRPGLEHLNVLGSTDRLLGIVRLFDVERVIVAFSRETHEQTIDLIHSLKDLQVQVDIVPRLFDLVGESVGIHAVEGLPLIGLPPLRLSRSSRAVKRALDLVVSVAGLVFLSPVLILIAAMIKLDSSGQVFFRQTRMGTGTRTFRIYKFRTMVCDADARKHEVAHLNKHAEDGDLRMFKIPDDPRVTRIGRFLRRYSLDELPQLINVARGEMSIVGPRPLILDEDQYVEGWARRRLELKPGITGYWQVLGRSDIPFEEMVKLDYLYVSGWSLFNDLKLMIRTLPALYRTRGAY